MKRAGIYNDVQAKTREQVIGAMQKKKNDLFAEIAFYDAGLCKIQGLQERNFYELKRGDQTFLVQCWKFGRDHVEFRVFTRDTDSKKIIDKMSLSWMWEWSTIPVDPKNASLYVNHGFKTIHYEKLLKGKYQNLNKKEFTEVDINAIN